MLADEAVYSESGMVLGKEKEVMARYVGVDLHRDCFTACVRSEAGRTQTRSWKLAQVKEFARTLKPADELAVEATGNTRYFASMVREKVSRFVVVNPSQFKVISQSVKKTDRNDAETLALYLSKGLLPEVRMKDEAHAQMASLAQTRDKLVKLRTTLKNKIHNILSARGIVMPKEAFSSQAGLNKVLAMRFDPMVMLELQVIVEQIRHLNDGIAKLDDQIKSGGKRLPGHENLTSIKGIGPTSASILLSVIGNVNDFADEGKLASYFGIVPKVDKSNQTEHIGRITKRGSKIGRTTLVQCTLIAKRYSPYLRTYYERIKKMRGSGKAIIATARKFLGIIYQTLKNHWVFEDFPNFVLADRAA